MKSYEILCIPIRFNEILWNLSDRKTQYHGSSVQSAKDCRGFGVEEDTERDADVVTGASSVSLVLQVLNWFMFN